MDKQPGAIERINQLHIERRKMNMYNLKPNQSRALKNIREGFLTEKRVQYISACGTGKTLVGYTYIDEILAAQPENQIIVLFFPSLALVSQTYEAYKNYGLDISKNDILFVCSDESVYEEETVKINPNELSFDVTTQEEIISSFITSMTASKDKAKNKIIFCTYHSSKILADSFKAAGRITDFALYDEAHKTASSNDSFFNYTLNVGAWFSNQKTNFKKGDLSQERIKLLDEIDTSWKPEKKN